MFEKGLKEAKSATRIQMRLIERSYSTLYAQFPIFCPLSPHPIAFTGICGNAIHDSCDGSVCQEKFPCALRVEMKYWREVIQLYAVQFSIFCPLSPHPSAFTGICGNTIHYSCDGVCVSRETSMYNKS